MTSDKVFLDYDQEALDRAYNQAAYAPNGQLVQRRMAERSEEARRRLGEPSRLAYGPTPHEQLDWFKAGRANAPVVIYVHGGAWRGNSARAAGHPAEMFVAAGASYVALDFILVEEAGGSLVPMAEQVRRAIAWVYRNAASFGGDPNRLYLAGHSSGAHLGACALTTDWHAAYGLPADVRGQAGRADLGRGIQPLRDVGDPIEPLRCPRPHRLAPLRPDVSGVLALQTTGKGTGPGSYSGLITWPHRQLRQLRLGSRRSMLDARRLEVFRLIVLNACDIVPTVTNGLYGVADARSAS